MLVEINCVSERKEQEKEGYFICINNVLVVMNRKLNLLFAMNKNFRVPEICQC